MVFLLWHDALPESSARDRVRETFAGQRQLDRHTMQLLGAAAMRAVHPMDALRMTCASLVITGAVGALKGRLHGGAPGPALSLVFEVGTADRAEAVLREKLGRGELLMGFGHRVYRTRDPRADVLGAAAQRLFDGQGDRQLYELARAVEACALDLLRERKPSRVLQTNVEFYTALVLHGLGFPATLFTPVFAAARVAGWTAHCLEQIAANRLFRPESVYVGARNRTWRPDSERVTPEQGR
jgi:citrate synthase